MTSTETITQTITHATTQPTTRAPRRSVRVGSATAAGRRGPTNEDAMLTGPHWYAIADGMGGHRAGDVAATLAIDVLAGFAGIAASTEPSTIRAVVDRAVARATDVVHRAATGPRSGMGTTVVGSVLLDDGSVAVFHVGDSRCYRLVDASLTLLTIDHTHVTELIDAGRLSPERAARHPLRHVLTRAIGIDPDVTADIVLIDPPIGRLLLCSDGVSAHLEAAAIRRILRCNSGPQAAADALVEGALAAGSSDDASAIVIDPS